MQQKKKAGKTDEFNFLKSLLSKIKLTYLYICLKVKKVYSLPVASIQG